MCLVIKPLSVAMVVLLFVSPPIDDNGSVIVIVVVIVLPFYSLPEVPLLYISIADWQAFDLIRMLRTLL
jgi:hypothetical protein